MGSQINTNARKGDFESTAFRTFDFEKILNNDSQDPDQNFFNAFNFKDSQHCTPEESKKNSKKKNLKKIITQDVLKTINMI